MWSRPRSSDGSVGAVGAVRLRSITFELTDDERAVFGLRQSGDIVVIGPGRQRLAWSLAAPAAVVVGGLFVAASDAPPLAIVVSLVLVGAAVATGLAFRREGVTLAPDSLSVQGRTGDPRRFGWHEVIDVVVQQRDGHDAGVLHVVGEPGIDLPGVVADDVDTKVALITRYRMSVHAR